MTRFDSEFPETRDSLLLQLKAGGDDSAWQEFVTMYRPIIYRIARKRGLQDADAQDLAQQVMVSISGAIERWEKKDESIRFRHWLRRIAKNAITNVLTRAPRDLSAGGTSIQSFLEGRVENRDELSQEIAFERRREMYCRAAFKVKSEVAADTWEIFELAVVNGKQIDEVAAQLNKSVGAAYAARGRVMARLRRLVEEMDKNES